MDEEEIQEKIEGALQHFESLDYRIYRNEELQQGIKELEELNEELQQERDWISTTIKRKHLDRILDGEKEIEYKKASEHWTKRLNKHRGQHDGDLGINFLCGQESFKFDVKSVFLWFHTDGMEIDGETAIWVYHIELGERLYADDTQKWRSE